LINEILVGWYFHEVTNGPDNAREYDFVAVDLYDSLAKLENPYPGKYFADTLSSDELEQLRKTGSVRTNVRTELWRIEAAAMGDNSSQAKTILLNYMKPTPGNGSKYVAAETGLFQKLHQHRIDEGGMNSWILARRMFPGGSGGEYHFVTLNMFENQEQLKKGWDGETVAPVYEKFSKEQQEVVDSIGELRTIVKGELWTLLDYVSSEEE
jgi:hypothetical protein